MAAKSTAKPRVTDAEQELSIVYRSLKSLAPYAKNSRTHSRAQIEKLKASLAEFGWTNSMLVAGNTVLAGHARLQAALEMAEEGKTVPRIVDPWTGPTVDLSHLSAIQRRAYIIADNRTALDAGWDDTILAEELGGLFEDGFDLSLTGFEDDDLARLLGGTAPGTEADPEDAPEPPLHPVTLAGDVWLLGKHRIICGDATDILVVDRVLAGVRPHLMVTDPPYGVDYDAADRGTARNGDGKLLSTGKGRATGRVSNDNKSDWREAWALFRGDVAYVWHAGMTAVDVANSMTVCGFEVRSQIVWAKSNLVVSRGHYHWQHEACWYMVRKGSTGHWSGDRKQSTLWQIDKPQKSETGHSTQKPIDCMQRPIENNSSPGQAVYDPFVGSGTTIIACELTGRCCLAIELDPSYVDVSVQRWQGVSGQEATLEGDGRSFDEMAAERKPGVA